MAEELTAHELNIPISRQEIKLRKETNPNKSCKLTLPKVDDLDFPMPSNKGYNKKDLLMKASFSRTYPSHDQSKLARKRAYLTLEY